MSNNHRTRSLAAIVLGITLLLALALATWLQPFTSPTPVAQPPLYSGKEIGSVAGDPIYLAQAAFRTKGLGDIHADTKQPKGTDWHELIVRSLADDIIIRKEAAKAGIGLDPVTLAAAVGSAVKGFGGQEAFQGYLKETGLTEPQFTMRVFMNLLAAKQYLVVTRDISVSEEDMRTFFDRHRYAFPEPNAEIAYAGARPEIEQKLLKKAQDKAYAQWLDEQRTKPEYEIKMTDTNWWEQI